MAPREAIVICPTCGQLQRAEPPPPGARLVCCRCSAVILPPKRESVSATAAFALAALVLYVPANLYPILRMTQYGAYSESTVWDGVVALAHSNQWFVAIVVFLASIVIPFLKLLGLFFLAITARIGTPRWARLRTRIYRFLEIIGPWAMLDVFLLAVLVALVKLGQYATVMPGPGLVAFTSMVVLTILATVSFDPRLIWQNAEGCDVQ